LKSRHCGGFFLLGGSLEAEKVFNTCVENSVEKCGRIFVSNSREIISAFCTGAGAGTSWPCRNSMVRQSWRSKH
jgi:hypothetical protein